MKKNIKAITGLIIALIIGISTTVTATTIFNSKDITYSSDKTTKTNVKDSLDELYARTNGECSACPEGQYCYTTPKTISITNIGDYISMTPTSTSYTPTSTDTGCLNDSYCTQNTLNPSELNMWRVIRKNEDGTVDVVSEYVSSLNVYFYGRTGYMNVVGGLNTIASQYTNEKYVIKTRHVGYTNQIEKCTTLSRTNCPIDTGYLIDSDLINKSIGTLIGNNLDGVATPYYLASRFIGCNADSTVDFYVHRHITTTGVVHHNHLYWTNNENHKEQGAIRPILTLKSDIEIKSGDGKSVDTAYQLN